MWKRRWLKIVLNEPSYSTYNTSWISKGVDRQVANNFIIKQSLITTESLIAKTAYVLGWVSSEVDSGVRIWGKAILFGGEPRVHWYRSRDLRWTREENQDDTCCWAHHSGGQLGLNPTGDLWGTELSVPLRSELAGAICPLTPFILGCCYVP